MMAAPSLHTPLSTEISIRPLSIYPWGPPDSISCNFHEADLEADDSSEADPLFTALSYTWGSEHDSRKISVNGHSVTIRRNLYDFLVYAKREGWVYNLWIDALCINQSDTHEKNKQVALMGHIYSRAYRVLIWLGELGDPESQGLLDFQK